MEIILGGCTKTHDTKLVPICTNLSLTGSWYKYVLVSIPQEAGTHMYSTNLYLTRSLYKKVQISLSQEAGTNMYKSLINREPVLICTNLSLAGSWYRYVHCTLYKPLSRRGPAQVCTNLSLFKIEVVCSCPALEWSTNIHRNILVDGCMSYYS